MILRTNPELPARANLSSKEPASYNLGEGLKYVSEANGGPGPILNNDENDENHNGAAWSACNTDSYDHDQLRTPNQWPHSEEVYVNDFPQLEAESTSGTANPSKSQYQPLITRRQNPEIQYDLAAFRPLNSKPSLQIEKVIKSQKIKQDTGTDIGATPCLHGQSNQQGCTVYSYNIGIRSTNVFDPNHYQPLSCKKLDKYPVYIGLSDIPHQPQTTCTSKVPLSITCHEYEDFGGISSEVY